MIFISARILISTMLFDYSIHAIFLQHFWLYYDQHVQFGVYGTVVSSRMIEILKKQFGFCIHCRNFIYICVSITTSPAVTLQWRSEAKTRESWKFFQVSSLPEATRKFGWFSSCMARRISWDWFRMMIPTT